MSKDASLLGLLRGTYDGLKKALARVMGVFPLSLAQKHSRLIFNVLSALLAGAFTHFLIGQFPYYPAALNWPLVLAVVLVWALRPNLGVALTLLIFLLPMAYNSLTLAMIFILFLILIAVVEIWAIGPYGFLVLAGVTAIFLRPQASTWLLAAPLLASFLGTRRAAVLGTLAGFWAMVLLAMSGKPDLGLLSLGAQTAPLLIPHPQPVTSLTDFAWLTAQTNAGSFDTDLVSALFAPFVEHPLLIAQVILWAVAAGVSSRLLSRSRELPYPKRYRGLLAGLVILGVGHPVLAGLIGAGAFNLGTLARVVLLPAVLVCAAAPLLEAAATALTPPVSELQPDEETAGGESLVTADDLSDGQPLHPAVNGAPQARAKRGPYDVFLSYSSKDKAVTGSLCACLESAGLTCWMAPRDVSPGEDWPTAITTAIGLSRTVVLVFSQNSNASEEVSRELYLAAFYKIPIIPFKIEDVLPEPGKAYYLGRTHWLDAANPPTPEHIALLLARVQSLLAPAVGSEVVSPAPEQAAEPEPASPLQTPTANNTLDPSL